MKTVVPDAYLVSMCGLYCGACGSFRSGKCMGCQSKTDAAWCHNRKCCMEKGHGSCASCTAHAKPEDECRSFNCTMAKVFSLIFRSDRKAGIRRIREVGKAAFAREMAARGRHALPRR